MHYSAARVVKCAPVFLWLRAPQSRIPKRRRCRVRDFSQFICLDRAAKLFYSSKAIRWSAKMQQHLLQRSPQGHANAFPLSLYICGIAHLYSGRRESFLYAYTQGRVSQSVVWLLPVMVCVCVERVDGRPAAPPGKCRRSFSAAFCRQNEFRALQAAVHVAILARRNLFGRHRDANNANRRQPQTVGNRHFFCCTHTHSHLHTAVWRKFKVFTKNC